MAAVLSWLDIAKQIGHIMHVFYYQSIDAALDISSGVFERDIQ
jgi:hypothetical protein